MTGPKGKLIVIEGTDGSGKKTQAALLIERLKRAGHKVATASFPQYGKKSAGPVEEYLNGKYGKAGELNPYVASLFFAVDRFDFSKELRRLLDSRYTVVLDRYVDSNAGHQGGKISSNREREKYIRWLYNLEYDILRVPEPDLTLILHVPARTGQKLVEKKQQRLYIVGGKKKDSLEADIVHLRRAEKTYLWLAKKFPKDHKVVECVENGGLLSPEKIHEKVWNVIKTLLPNA